MRASPDPASGRTPKLLNRSQTLALPQAPKHDSFPFCFRRARGRIKPDQVFSCEERTPTAPSAIAVDDAPTRMEGSSHLTTNDCCRHRHRAKAAQLEPNRPTAIAERTTTRGHRAAIPPFAHARWASRAHAGA